jgi:hypothetical protein
MGISFHGHRQILTHAIIGPVRDRTSAISRVDAMLKDNQHRSPQDSRL